MTTGGAHVGQSDAESGRNASQAQKENPVFSGVCESVPDDATGTDGPNWTRTSGLHDVNVAL